MNAETLDFRAKNSGVTIAELTDQEFKTFQSLIYREAGISLSDAKKTLVYSRLARRLRELGLLTYSDYIEYLEKHDADGRETQELVNRLTTNKTEFFREPHHFDYLKNVVFPQAEERAKQGGPREVSIWSSASSTGEEPYTIAMCMLEYFGLRSNWRLKVLATDINTEVLDQCRSGRYAIERLDDVPVQLRQKYFLRGTGANASIVRVRPEVQQLIEFRQMNLLSKPLPVRGPFNAIFCRNVIIYFDRPTQQQLLPQFAEHLIPGGHLFLGHSENVPWLTGLFEPLGGTVHRLKNGGAPAMPRIQVVRPGQPRSATADPKPNGSGLANAKKGTTVKKRMIVAGETFATNEHSAISTVLGSCVAACLYDPAKRIGGMNHFMLPFQTDNRTASGRYGVHAMELLINQIMKLGGDRDRLKAKVFGGAKILASESENGVGQGNVDFILEFLKVEGITIESQKLGGEEALRVLFIPTTGQAFVKPIISTRQLFESEQRDSQRAWKSYETSASTSSTLF